jgi:N-acylneuraminate cytidylyltransferase
MTRGITEMEKLLTIIPARGGSKSIPKKNLQMINGQSLIERAVNNALKVENNRIIVSTDDLQIIKTIKNYPIEIFQRSSKNSSDFASSESVVIETLEKLGNFKGIVALLQATSPFLDLQGFCRAIEFLGKSDVVHSMFSAVEKNEFLWEFQNSWEPTNHNKYMRLPRQSRAKTAVETGSFYIFKSDKFIEEKTRFCGVTMPAFTKKWSDFDIDNQEDLDFCRSISKVLDFPPFLG